MAVPGGRVQGGVAVLKQIIYKKNYRLSFLTSDASKDAPLHDLRGCITKKREHLGEIPKWGVEIPNRILKPQGGGLDFSKMSEL